VLRLPDHWVWDSWIADDGQQYHLFFLRASRALVAPIRRHRRAAIGHATSVDLRTWQLGPDALVHSDGPAWDDMATWTGSTIRADDGRWWLFYTGLSHAENGRVQRIGAATSDDMVTWFRVPDGPLLEADPRWYEKVDSDVWFEGAWRDPFVFRDPAGDGWHMLVTARANDGPVGGRGVIGHARSANLLTWDIQPPLTEPAGFGHQEVPQVRMVQGHPLLVFSCLDVHMAASISSATQRKPAGAVWTALGESLLGPWDLAHAKVFDHPTAYAGQLVHDRAGNWYLHAFDDGPNFDGIVLDPIPVHLSTDGFEPVTGTAMHLRVLLGSA
jgi:beta-fructofuranosidase